MEMANRKAQEMVRVAVGRAAAAQPVYKDLHHCRPVALVIGGGVAGMTAALAIADSGYDVHLVERADMLGGNLLNLYYVAEGYNPQHPPARYRQPGAHASTDHRPTPAPKSRVTGGTSAISVPCCARTCTDGTAEDQQIEHGVTIVATGARETRNHPWLTDPDLYPEMITQRELEEKIIHQPGGDHPPCKDVVMVQCMRPPGSPEYCSRVCCTNAMKNAIRLKLFNPNCRVTSYYKNIVTYGFREQYYTEARALGVIFVRYTDDEPPT